MYHCLFVADLVITKIGSLLECLADAGDVSMPEDAKTPGKELLLQSVTFDKLVFEKPDDRLSRGVADRGH
jgi:hypothetical protein